MLPLQRGNQANKGKNNFKIPKRNGMFLHWLGLLSFTTATTASKALQVTLKHEQVDGWRSGRAADGKDCACNLQGKREKHQQDLTRRTKKA